MANNMGVITQLEPSVSKRFNTDRTIPRSRQGQLLLLAEAIDQAGRELEVVVSGLEHQWNDQALRDAGRRQWLRRVDAVAWKAQREIAPLVDQVPRSLQTHPAYLACLDAANRLRTRAQEVRRDNVVRRCDLETAVPLPQESNTCSL